jgi:FkbM family methyltransferase
VVAQIEDQGISTVLDIGANVGQFALDLRMAGYKGAIVSIEPGSAAFKRLEKISSKDALWQVYNFAIGSKSGFSNLNISANKGLSSSLLEMANHIEYFPESKTISVENVRVETIDDFIEEKRIKPERLLLKIDTQGFEVEVLKGAVKILDRVKLVYCETSLEPLYQNEQTYLYILNFLKTHGHDLIEVTPGIRSHEKKLLQIDVLTRTCNAK